MRYLSCVLGLLLLHGLAAAREQGNSTREPLARDSAQDFVYLGDARPVLYRLHIFVDGKPLHAAWSEFIDYVLNYLDTNRDGVLSKDEAERAPPTSVLFTANQFGGFVPPTMTQLDLDRDGKVTAAELGAYYRKNGAAAFQVQMGQAQQQFYQVINLDGRMNRPTSAEALNEALFKLLDADNDGRLTAAELLSAPLELLKRDANDDEMVASGELVGTTAPTDELFVAQQLLVDGTRQPAQPSFLTLNPGEPRTPLGRQLHSRYAPKGAPKGGGNPTRASSGLDEATFGRLDADGNGELDAEELARFAERPADVEVIVRLGTVPAGKLAVEIVSDRNAPSPLAASLKAKGAAAVLDFGTTRLELTTGGRDAGPQIRFSNQQFFKMQFTAADRDNNGYLDRTEAQKNGLFRDSFRAMDRDGDGQLFEKEMLAYFTQVEGLQAKATAGCCSLNISDQGRGLFDLLDRNRDGRLSVREMRAAVQQLESLDQNGDQQLAKGEIPRNYQLAVRRGGVGQGQFSGQVVVAARTTGAGGPRVAPPTAGPTWFRKMDRNGDGDVSRREFLGTDADFRRLDTDGDGLLSPAEAERAARR